MKSSTHLIRFRRLLIVGAVVAGIGVPTAGAMPVFDGPAATVSHTTPAGLKADGLRMQGIAQVYTYLANSPTPQGLKADGLRMQGIAKGYQQLQSATAPDVFERYAAQHPYGRGLSLTPATLVSRPPDVQDAADSLSSSETLVSRPPDVSDTAQALQSNTSVNQSSGFDWNDWGIGIGTGIGVALLLGVAFVMSRQHRHVQPA